MYLKDFLLKLKGDIMGSKKNHLLLLPFCQKNYMKKSTLSWDGFTSR
jgi:hypothetical protein